MKLAPKFVPSVINDGTIADRLRPVGIARVPHGSILELARPSQEALPFNIMRPDPPDHLRGLVAPASPCRFSL